MISAEENEEEKNTNVASVDIKNSKQNDATIATSDTTVLQFLGLVCVLIISVSFIFTLVTPLIIILLKASKPKVLEKRKSIHTRFFVDEKAIQTAVKVILCAFLTY